MFLFLCCTLVWSMRGEWKPVLSHRSMGQKKQTISHRRYRETTEEFCTWKNKKRKWVLQYDVDKHANPPTQLVGKSNQVSLMLLEWSLPDSKGMRSGKKEVLQMKRNHSIGNWRKGKPHDEFIHSQGSGWKRFHRKCYESIYEWNSFIREIIWRLRYQNCTRMNSPRTRKCLLRRDPLLSCVFSRWLMFDDDAMGMHTPRLIRAVKRKLLFQREHICYALHCWRSNQLLHNLSGGKRENHCNFVPARKSSSPQLHGPPPAHSSIWPSCPIKAFSCST